MEEKTVDLSLMTLIRECAIRPELGQDIFYDFCFANRENIHEVFKYKKFNEDFTSRVSCYRKDGQLIGTIRPCYEEFLEKLVYILNIPVRGKIKDNDDLTKTMLERLEVLKSISTENELRLEFPMLYKDLQDGRRYFNDLQKIRRQEHYDEEQFASGEHYYYGCALKKSLPNFIKTQAVQYERYITDRSKLRELQESKSYNNLFRKYFDVEKFYFYTMHEYLRKCEGSKDRVEIKKYLDLFETYLNSNHRKDITITTDEGIKVDYDNLIKRYNNLRRIVSDNSSLVDWVLVPEGRKLDRVTKEGESKVTLMNIEEINRLRSLGERKRVFYESSPYIAKAIGLRRYRGYIAYIYKNGEVILDREYNEDSPSTALGNAIYIMKADKFESLSKLDKQNLRKHPEVTHWNHTNTWMNRVQLVIEREGTPLEEESSKALVKRLQTKR